MDLHVVAIDSVESPSRRVLDVNVLNRDMLAIHEENHRAGSATISRSEIVRGHAGPGLVVWRVSLLRRFPEARALPVDTTGAGDCHVIRIHCKNQVAGIWTIVPGRDGIEPVIFH